MPNRRLNWNSALRGLKSDRLTPQPVREVGRMPGTGLSSTLSSWIGQSRSRYTVRVHAVARVEPSELLDATVLFVGRDLEGRAKIASGHRDLTAVDAEGLIEKALARGLTEVHVHLATEGADARLAVLVDLAVPNLRVVAQKAAA